MTCVDCHYFLGWSRSLGSAVGFDHDDGCTMIAGFGGEQCSRIACLNSLSLVGEVVIRRETARATHDESGDL